MPTQAHEGMLAIWHDVVPGSEAAEALETRAHLEAALRPQAVAQRAAYGLEYAGRAA